MSAYSPRFVAYAATLGLSPEEALAADAVEFPGGKMCGFLLWVGQQWRAWRLAHGVHFDAPLTEAHHASFDRSLS